jgi:hypothetical protein
MDAPEMFPGEHEVREEAARAGWSTSVGNGWAALFASPEDEGLTLRAYASFFEAGVRPAFLIVETLDGDPKRAPLGLQVWVGPRVPSSEDARALLDEHGVVCSWFGTVRGGTRRRQDAGPPSGGKDRGDTTPGEFYPGTCYLDQTRFSCLLLSGRGTLLPEDVPYGGCPSCFLPLRCPLLRNAGR